jgi:hypothetical protein
MDARRRAGAPERHDLADFREGQSKAPSLTDEREQTESVSRVAPIARGCPMRRRQDALRFVQPQRFSAESAARRDFPDEEARWFHVASIRPGPWVKVKHVARAPAVLRELPRT